MAISRRGFLGATGLLAGTAALSPLIKVRRAFGDHAFDTHHLVVVGIGGGLRNREALGMAEGATMPNLFGTTPLISGFGAGSAGAPRIAPEYAALVPDLVLPAPRPQPLYTQGTLITNLRYAEGAPGHLQGQACLMSGYYNNLENRADARLPVPTIFEIHRRQANAAATDAWYVSVVGGFYRALQASDHPGYGARFGGSFLAPPGVASPLVPIVTSGRRAINITTGTELPTIPYDADEDSAVGRLRGVLDGNYPAGDDRTTFHSTAAENAAKREHLAAYYADGTYESFFPESFGIGLRAGDGGLDSTNDALTVYHAEQVLDRFRPSILGMTLIDVDACHTDFNGYLRGQQVADACVNHLWSFIQSHSALRDRTTMIVLPEHGRHLYFNGQNPDSLGRSGLDHGEGDDGDRNVWALVLGPDTAAQGVVEPTGITQTGRSSGRYETIDAIMTGMTLLGHGDRMSDTLSQFGARPGLMMSEVLA